MVALSSRLNMPINLPPSLEEDFDDELFNKLEEDETRLRDLLMKEFMNLAPSNTRSLAAWSANVINKLKEH